MYVPKDPTPGCLRWLAGFIVAWVLVCAVFYAHGQAIPRRDPRVQAATLDWLSARLEVKEVGVNNGGPAVEALVRAGGGPAAQHPEWCGFTQAACQRAFGLPIPPNGLQGGARYWFVPSSPRTFFLAGRRGSLDSIQPGDLVGVPYGGVIHHIMRTKKKMPADRAGRPPRGFYTLAGNEGRFPGGMRLTYYPGPNLGAAARWDYR